MLSDGVVVSDHRVVARTECSEATAAAAAAAASAHARREDISGLAGRTGCACYKLILQVVA